MCRVLCLLCAGGVFFSVFSIACAQQWDADFNRDFVVDWSDFIIFAGNWLQQDCGQENAWCWGTDITIDGQVQWDDFDILSAQWFAVACLDLPPQQRTLQCPDSWLILYNRNNSQSVEWAQWYAHERSIPAENLLALDLPADVPERLGEAGDGLAVYENDIRDPVLDYLANHASVQERLMGILVGFGVPGTFLFQSQPAMNGGGGYSIASALQMPARDYRGAIPSPLYPNPFQDAPTPLTKAAMNAHPGIYVTARIDAPTLQQAKDLTLRAKAIEVFPRLPADQQWWYDAVAESYGGLSWYDLIQTVEIGHPDLPWASFSCETDDPHGSPANDAFRFGWYRLSGWNTAATLAGTPPGLRVFSYELNSFGCTTLRDTNALSGRAVPNVLFRAGYASAVGATAEPGSSPWDPGWHEPDPGIIVDRLREGRPVVEAFFVASPRLCWMWEWVGDPFLRVRIDPQN